MGHWHLLALAEHLENNNCALLGFVLSAGLIQKRHLNDKHTDTRRALLLGAQKHTENRSPIINWNPFLNVKKTIIGDIANTKKKTKNQNQKPQNTSTWFWKTLLRYPHCQMGQSQALLQSSAGVLEPGRKQHPVQAGTSESPSEIRLLNSWLCSKRKVFTAAEWVYLVHSGVGCRQFPMLGKVISELIQISSTHLRVSVKNFKVLQV